MRTIKTILAAAFFLATFVPKVSAIPPQSMEAAYDADAKVLHVNIQHLSRNVKKHRIRKITVTKNDRESQDFFYPKQDPQGLVVDIPFEAESGDKLIVKAFCSEAGSEEVEVSVP